MGRLYFWTFKDTHQQLEGALAVLKVVHIGHCHDLIRIVHLRQVQNLFFYLLRGAGGAEAESEAASGTT